MTTPVANASVYGDFAGLERLKSSLRHDPDAIRQVARQFEGLFARMMIKSMRDAIGRDPIFGSDQAQLYQGMFDDQLSLELTRGRGLGLADMLVRQLQRAGGTAAGGGAVAGGAAAASPTTGATSPEQASFIRELWPQAQQAARQLGVHPVSLIAQAALESNWGRSVPRNASGESSHNLFGIKAGADWSGAAVTTSTQEFRSGAPVATRSAFRAYASPAASLEDYVALLRSNPRFSGALGSGANVQAFASALQRGGYATDPDYVQKVTSVASRVAAAVFGGAARSVPLKFASALPISARSGAL